MKIPNAVWLFSGEKARFTSAVFTRRDLAEEWIKKHKLSGILTAYPLDISAYDWALSNDLFKPTKEHHLTPEFIGGFTTASQEHYHYTDGEGG